VAKGAKSAPAQFQTKRNNIGILTTPVSGIEGNPFHPMLTLSIEAQAQRMTVIR